MRKLALSLVSVAMISLSACAAPETASLDDPADDTPGIISDALKDLGDRPVLEFEGAVDKITGSGDATSMTADVLENGTSYGTADVDGHEIKMMRVDKVYYVSGPKSFWIAQGIDEAYAKKIDGKWTQVDPEKWFNPGVLLTPAQYTKALEDAIEQAGTTDNALPETEKLDGVEVHKTPVGDGFVYITAEEPHRIVKIEDVAVSVKTEGSESFDLTLNTAVSSIDNDAVEALLTKFKKAVKDISSVYDNGADLKLSESDQKFDCDNSSFKCKFSVKVDTNLNGEYHVADEVKVTLKAKADGGKLGTKKCDKSKTVDVDKAATLSCGVSFSVPADGVQYDIKPDWSVTGVASFHPDTKKISKKLEEDFEKILDEME